MAFMSHDMFKPCKNWEFLQSNGWRWGLVLQILFFVKGDSPAVLLVAAVVTVLFMGSRNSSKYKIQKFHLNIITSTIHADTFPVLAGELVQMAGA